MNNLIKASILGNVDVEEVKLLLLSGADINAINNYGFSSLMYASMNGHHEIVKVLLLYGADVNAKNNFGYSSLLYASINGHIEIVKLLLLSGADVNDKDNFRVSSLMWASKYGHLKIIEILLQSGANIYYSFEDKDAFTIAENDEVRKILLKYTTKGILKEVPHYNIIDDNINYLS